jgi:hypothetical protein
METSLVERRSLSFEDWWKLHRKKFKENTRRSFVAAYNNIADLIEGRTNERLRDLHFQSYHNNHSDVEPANNEQITSESNVKKMIKRFSVVSPPPP